MAMPTEDRRRTVAVAAALVAVGVALRVWRAGDLVVWLDEVWAPRAATEHTIGWLFTHFYFADACIPLALYAKCLLETVGLVEWSLRLPSLLAGCLTVGLVAWVCVRALPRAQAWLATGVVAICPYLVYLAREARPYPITMLLFSVMLALVVGWTRGRPGSWLVAAAICGATSVWFHAVTALSVVLLWLYPIAGLAVGRIERARARDIVVASVVAIVCGALLMLPAAASMREFMRQSVLGNKPGSPDAATVSNGLALLAGVPVAPPILLWVAVAAIGFGWLGRRHRAETGLATVLVVSQVAVFLSLTTSYLDIPMVWLRYHAHLLPIFLVVVACGVLAPVDALVRNRTGRVAPAAALLLVVVSLAAHARARHYSVSAKAAYNANPILAFLPDGDDVPVTLRAVRPRFYETALQRLPPGAIVEAPTSMLLPLSGVYQRWHGRPVVAGALGDDWQSLFTRPGMRFHTVVPVTREGLRGSGARVLVVHKRMNAEVQAVWEALRATPGVATQFWHMPVFPPGHRQAELGADPRVLPFPATPIYEDEDVAAYDIQAL